MLRLLSVGQDGGEPATIEETFARDAEKRKRVAYLAIPITLGVGLLIATLYIGVRMVGARRQVAPVAVHQVSVPAVVRPVAKVEPAVVRAVKPAKQVKPSAPLTLITPRGGETYLQLAAVTPHTVLRYLDDLRQSNLEPRVAPGPTTGLLRVLVGPFADSASLKAAKARLDADKMIWIVRAY